MAASDRRFVMLDGWRTLSILLVMAGHLLPIGPAFLGFNSSLADGGMALFFCLSGFLITRFLLHDQNIGRFLTRRFLRIIPLAWPAFAFALWRTDAPVDHYVRNLLFIGNLPPQVIPASGGHLWSLGVEMQFYVGVALLVALTGRRGLMALPLLAIAVTAYRCAIGSYIDIVTWRRLDEILAGATLALIFEGKFGPRPGVWLARLNVYWMLGLMLLSATPGMGALAYVRPYITAAMVGASLYAPPPRLERIAGWRATAYIAEVSYALYVFHGLLMTTWLASGDRIVKYLKRPLLFAVTFLLAHLSTYYYERRFTEVARRLTGRRHPTATSGAVAGAPLAEKVSTP